MAGMIFDGNDQPVEQGGITGYGAPGMPAPTPTAAPGSTPTSGGGDSAWILQALQAVQSTDDPNYWIQQITAHGDLNNPAARQYWIDRINRGDGSMLVRNGTLQKYGDSGSAAAPGAAPGGTGQPYNFSTDDPSYAWRLGQGMDALQKSAAARGTLLTGGTLKDLTNYAQGAASQEYQNAFNRKFDLARLGADAANMTGGAGSSFGSNSLGALGQLGNAQSAGSMAQGKLWGNALNNLSTLGRSY